MTPNFFDIHSHLNFPEFDDDRDEIIKKNLDEGIWTIIVGVDLRTSILALEIAQKYKEGVYASVGFHPDEADDFDFIKLEELIKEPKVVAIGECGLDYYYARGVVERESKNQDRQKNIFERQIELALKLDRSLMIHCRDAHEDMLEIISRFKIQNPKLRGNIHFFSGTLKEAQRYFDLGFTISFAGVITFARDYDEVIKKSPIDKMMVETDAPFVAPIPYRGKRNQPNYVKEVVRKISEIRGLTFEETARLTTQNALRFFKI